MLILIFRFISRMYGFILNICLNSWECFLRCLLRSIRWGRYIFLVKFCMSFGRLHSTCTLILFFRNCIKFQITQLLIVLLIIEWLIVLRRHLINWLIVLILILILWVWSWLILIRVYCVSLSWPMAWISVICMWSICPHMLVGCILKLATGHGPKFSGEVHFLKLCKLFMHSLDFSFCVDLFSGFILIFVLVLAHVGLTNFGLCFI